MKVESALTQDVEDFLEIFHLSSALDQFPDCLVRTFNRFGNLVNILWFNNGFEVVFQKFSEVI